MIKKKIGILTFLYAYNHGSLLQALAVRQILEKVFIDDDIRYINYIPKIGLFKELYNNLINRRFYSGLKMTYKFYKEIRNNYNFWPTFLISDDYKDAIKFCEDLKLDLIAIGSDTVFESRPKGLGYTPSPPNIFFGSSILEAKQISISASSDRTIIEQWGEDSIAICKKNMENFKYISVRDSFTKSMLNNLFEIKSDQINVLPDPTFFLNLVDNFKLLSAKFNIKKKKYAVLDISNRVLSKLIKKHLKEQNIKVISPMANRYSDLNLRGEILPKDWVSLHRNSFLNITNRFHGTVFSIKNGTNFISFDESVEYTKGASSKKESLLKELGLEQRLISMKDESIESAFVKIKLLSKPLSLTESKKMIDFSDDNYKKWNSEIKKIAKITSYSK